MTCIIDHGNGCSGCRDRKVREILADHDEKYLNHPPGAGSNMALLMLCEDTIARIKHTLGLT